MIKLRWCSVIGHRNWTYLSHSLTPSIQVILIYIYGKSRRKIVRIRCRNISSTWLMLWGCHAYYYSECYARFPPIFTSEANNHANILSVATLEQKYTDQIVTRLPLVTGYMSTAAISAGSPRLELCYLPNLTFGQVCYVACLCACLCRFFFCCFYVCISHDNWRTMWPIITKLGPHMTLGPAPICIVWSCHWWRHRHRKYVSILNCHDPWHMR